MLCYFKALVSTQGDLFFFINFHDFAIYISRYINNYVYVLIAIYVYIYVIKKRKKKYIEWNSAIYQVCKICSRIKCITFLNQ